MFKLDGFFFFGFITFLWSFVFVVVDGGGSELGVLLISQTVWFPRINIEISYIALEL